MKSGAFFFFGGLLMFIGGFGVYLDICAEVAGAGYKGFSLHKTS